MERYDTVRRSSRSRRRRRGNATAKTLLFLVLFLVVAALVTLLILTLPHSGTDALTGYIMPFEAGDTFVPFRSGAVYLDKEAEELWYVDAKGNKGWGFRHADATLQLESSSELVAAWGGDKLQVISSTGKILLNKQYESEIKAVRCGRQYICVVLHDRTRVTDSCDGSVLLVYDTNGNLVDKIDDLSFFLMDFGFFGDDDQLFAVLNNTDSVTMNSRIAVYNPAQQKSTGYVRIDGELIYETAFTANEIFAVTTEHIYAFSYTGDLQSKIPCGGRIALTGTSYTSRANLRFLLAATDSNGRFSSCGIYTAANGLSMINTAVENVGAFCSSDGKVYLFGCDIAQVIDAGGVSRQYALPHSADRILAEGGSEGYVFTVSGAMVFCVKLP